MQRMTNAQNGWRRKLVLLCLTMAAMCCAMVVQAQDSAMRISAKGDGRAVVGAIVDYAVTVETAKGERDFPIVTNAQVEYHVPAELEPLEARSELGSCRLADSSTFVCDLGELPYNAKVQVDFRVRAVAGGAAQNDFITTGRIFACEFFCDVGDRTSVVTEIAEPVDPLSISPTQAQIDVGDSVQLSTSGGQPPFEWQSSDEEVASVDNGGLVVGRSAGRSTIVVSDAAGQRATADIEVTEVIEPLRIDSHPSSLTVNDSFTVRALGGRPPYTWRSNDTDIATVSDEGTVTGISAGTVRVNVTDASGQEAQSDDIRVIGAVSVSPRSGTLKVGDTLQFDVDGGIAPYSWRSSDDTIARVDDNGRLTAVRPGTVQVTVTDGADQSATTDDIVIGMSLEVSPQTGQLVVGETLQFDAAGGVGTLDWSVSDSELASINGNGLLTAVAPGTLRVRVTDSADQTASTDDIRIISRLRVTPEGGTVSVGGTLQFSAEGGTGSYRWRVSDDERAQISDSGLLTARRVGTVTVTVTDDSGQDVTSGEVRIIDSLALSPSRSVVMVGETLQFQVSGGIGPYTWRTSDADIARIDEEGRLSAVSPGVVQVTVNDSNGQSATTDDITIAATLQITPRVGQLTVGESLQFEASGGIGGLSWSVSNTELARISSDGLLTARAAGQVTVSVRDAQGNQAATDGIDITAALRISPSSAVLAVGSTLQLQASGGLEPYAWESSNASIGEIDNSGALTARSAGTLRITVTDRSGQRATTSDITVAAELGISPNNASLVVGDSQDFTVQGGVAPYRWSVTDAAVASITQNGGLSALAAGTVRVRVTDALNQTISSDDIRVVGQLSVAPDGGTVSVGGTLQFTAQGGASPYRWRVSDDQRAAISDSGLLTAQSVGTVNVTVIDDSGQEMTSGAVHIIDSLALSPATGTLVVGESLQFQASGGVTPYRWGVSDDELADINGDGQLSAKRAGRVTVTVTDAQDNEVSSEPIELVGNLSITPRTAGVAIGETLAFELSGGLGPYQWSSSDTSVATINSRGQLTALAAGRVRISVSDRSGQRNTTDDIEVRAGLSVAPTQVTLQVDQTVLLQATGGTPPYRWTSADEEIATVDDEGRVTGQRAGASQIILRDADDGEVRVNVTVQTTPVEPPTDGGSGPPSTPGELYRVSVYTTDANAVESGSSGAFTIFLDRPAESPGVTVRYRIGDSSDAPRADNDVLADSSTGVAPLPGEVTIPTGEISATVVIQPVNNSTADGARPIVLSLLPGDGYEIVSDTAAATLVIVDDEVDVAAPVADAAALLTIERIEGAAIQSARVDTALAFAVRVVDGDSNPVAGAAIAWELSARGASAGGQLTNEDNATDVEGQAGVTLNTGPFPGVYEVTARASLDGAGSASVSFLVNAGLVDIVDPHTPEGAVGVALDAVCPHLRNTATRNENGELLLDRCTEIYGAYANGEDAALLRALRSIAPEEVAAQGTVGMRFALRQLRNIDERLRNVRRGHRAISLSGLSFNINGETLPGSVFDMARRDPIQGGAAGDAIGDDSSESGFDERTGLFITGALDMLEKSRTAQESGFDAQTQGVTVGIDRRVTDSWVFGAALGYGATEMDLSADGGNLDSDSYTVSGYASFAWDERFFIDAILSYGSTDYELLRRIDYSLSTGSIQRSASGETDGAQLSGAVSGGYAWNKDDLEVEVFGRLEHTRGIIDAYQESGAAEFDLALAEQTLEATYVSVGGVLSQTYGIPWGVLQPQLSLSWEHEIADAYAIQGRFVADPSDTSFTFQSDEPDSDYLRASLGASAIFANGVTAFVQYEETLQRSNLDESALSFGVRFYRSF